MINIRQNILVYDCEETGHHIEYIEYFTQYLLNNEQSGLRLFCLVHPKTLATNKVLIGQLVKENISFIPLSEEDLNKIEREKGTLKRSLIEENILRIYVEKLDIHHLCFLNIDPYQYIVGKWAWTKSKLSVSGILFQPYFRIPIYDVNGKFNWSAYFTRFRKYLQLIWLRQNKALKALHVFNDNKGVVAMNTTFGIRGDVFRYLPDPILKRTIAKGFSLKEKYQIEEKSLILLCFGSISERKNILNILEATKLLSSKVTNEIVVLIVGRCPNKMYEAKIAATSANIEHSAANIRVIQDGQFISVEEMESIFEQSDIVLIPYLDFYVSSGVLGHAAKHGKRVVASEEGVIGDLVSEYQLGTLCKPTIASSISEAIQIEISNLHKKPLETAEFLKNHSYERFINSLLLVFN